MLFPIFKAVRRGADYSLRVIYPDSTLPGDGSSQFGRLRRERRGWNVWGDDQDFGKALRAACQCAGQSSDIKVVLAEIRKTYMEWHHPGELGWVATKGPEIDTTGDLLWDTCQRLDLKLVEKKEGGEGERPTLVYLNPVRAVKLKAAPHWDATRGDIYSLTLYEKLPAT